MSLQEEQLAELIEKILSTGMTPEEKDLLNQLLLDHPDLRIAYLRQLQTHYILERYGILENTRIQKNIRQGRFRFGLKIAICLSLLLSLSVFFMARYSSVHADDREIIVERISEDDERWVQEMSPVDRQHYRENMGFVQTDSEDTHAFIKYGPGEIENPGAAIEILPAPTEISCQKHLLQSGDRVWRDRIRIEEGLIHFKIINGSRVTIRGPVDVEIKNPHELVLHSGVALIETEESPVTVSIMGRPIILGRSTAGFLLKNQKESSDILLFHGNAEIPPDELYTGTFLCERDGIRLYADKYPIRYRKPDDFSKGKDYFLSGKLTITVCYKE